MTEYTPTVWQDGDAITAEKLNKIENRIEEIQSIERILTNPSTITYNEAKQLLDQGIFPCLIFEGEIDYIIKYSNEDLTVTTLYHQKELYASSEDSELSFIKPEGDTGGDTGGTIVK